MRPLSILLVEDNVGDVRLAQEAFFEASVCNSLSIAKDGAEALALLRGPNTSGGRHVFDLVLLDLNLPRVDGRQVLRAMRSDSVLRDISVAIFVPTLEDEGLEEFRGDEVVGFLTKPFDILQFLQVLARVKNFALAFVTLDAV